MADNEAFIPSVVEVSEASKELRKKALAECKLPDKSLKELLEKEGTAHENTAGNDEDRRGKCN